MILDDKLRRSQHVDHISSKITHNIGILKCIQHFIPKESLLLLYHTLIEPYFRYCSIIWGQSSETLKDKLQTFQNKAAQTIAKVCYDEANHSKGMLPKSDCLDNRFLRIRPAARFSKICPL